MSELYMSESYNIVDEKIIKLKKLEFLFSNLTEFLKHYIIVQDIIVRAIFEGYNEVKINKIRSMHLLIRIISSKI